MRLAIAQHISSFEALDRQLAYVSISADPEDYHRCVARERTLEMQICRESGVPFFLILETPKTRGIRVSGRGGQDPFKRHLLFDADRNPVESLVGYEVLLRTSVSHERTPLEFIEEKGGTNVADWPSQQKTLEWYKHVRPEFLKRRLAWFPIAEALRQNLSTFKDDRGMFFAKTNFKAHSGITESLVSLLGYDLEMMPPTTEVIVSEPLGLWRDGRGKLEYRCYVVRNRVSSISRYIDYDAEYEIPVKIEDFAESFVLAHRNILPDCYVLDVAEAEQGLVVIELNGIVASGRYEKNCFAKLLADLAA